MPDKSHTFISFPRIFRYMNDYPPPWIEIIDYEGIHPGIYFTYESYCPSSTCDCNETKIDFYENVENTPFIASIIYKINEPVNHENPFLDPNDYQSELADVMFAFLKSTEFSFFVLTQPLFQARSQMMKDVGKDPNHPLYSWLHMFWDSSLK